MQQPDVPLTVETLDAGRTGSPAFPVPLADVVIAVTVAVVGLASLVTRTALVREDDDAALHFASADLTGVALVLGGALPLLVRRRAPVPVLAVTTLAFGSYHRLGYAPPPLPLAPIVALYTVAVEVTAMTALVASAALVLGILALSLTQQGPLTDDEYLAYGVAVAAAWALGGNVRVKLLSASVTAARADQLLAENAREAAAALALERARIARELHDVVTHHVSLMVRLAGAARIRGDGSQTLAATLAQIEASGRDATQDMRRMLDVLHPDAVAPGDPSRLDHVPVLVDRARAAGVRIHFTVEGPARTLPAAVDLAAFRIVQAALANAIEHARGSQVSVAVAYGAGEVSIRIRDDGKRPPGSDDHARGEIGRADRERGRGLIGMATRTMSLGGRLDVRPDDGGGFEISVVLPCPDGARW